MPEKKETIKKKLQLSTPSCTGYQIKISPYFSLSTQQLINSRAHRPQRSDPLSLVPSISRQATDARRHKGDSSASLCAFGSLWLRVLLPQTYLNS